MIIHITLSLLASCAIAKSEVFSIALVKRTESDTTEFMTLLKNGKSVSILIDKNRILVREDLHIASLNLLSKSILVQLNDEGARKIQKATGAMELGKEQLAFIAGNELISTAVVRGKLGKSFEITGLDHFKGAKLQEIVAQINRRDEQDIQTLVKPEKNHSGAIRFASDSATYGLSVNEFKRKFGIPTKISEGPNDGDVSLWYQIDRAKIPVSSDGSAMPDIGVAVFHNDKLVKITNDYSDEQKLKNPIMSQPSTLLMNAPDLKKIDKGVAEYLEKITIQNIHQKINKRDIMDVLSLLAIAEQASSDNDKIEAMIRVDCDMMKLLSLHFVEIKNLGKVAKNGKIKYSALNSVVQDYLSGKKSIP
jgi:hypothetical protein